MPAIVEARTPEHLGQARSLFIEYASGLDFSLEFQGFSEELATLPGKYAAPGGCILLALVGAAAVGCVALRPLGADERGRLCEMKRLYVRPSHRGRGLGLDLATRIVGMGRELGYAAMRLDTGRDMLAAVEVYRRLGFRPVERYNHDTHPDTLFFEFGYG
ncbi:MAG: GNAT family N-acetyltransferase [Phycisphaerales bacterium]